MKKLFLKLILAALLMLQFNVCSAAPQYDEEMALPIGQELDVDMGDMLERIEYDSNMVTMKQVDKREVPVLKALGDTVITYVLREGDKVENFNVLIHCVSPDKYDEMTDDKGELKPQYRTTKPEVKNASEVKPQEVTNKPTATQNGKAAPAAKNETVKVPAKEVKQPEQSKKAEEPKKAPVPEKKAEVKQDNAKTENIKLEKVEEAVTKAPEKKPAPVKSKWTIRKSDNTGNGTVSNKPVAAR